MAQWLQQLYEIPWLKDLADDFKLNFIDGDRWKWLWEGLGNTLYITFFALLIGVAIGVLIAAVRSSYDRNQESLKRRGGIGYHFLRLCNAICKIYLTVIRGTPVLVQLMIWYFVVFASSRNGLMIAAFAFGINSGAYVAEIIRSGIMSVDVGQMEAGRSLGFGYVATMRHIILPQAFKAVLPALANEFIVLLKETSVASFVSVADLTYAGNIIGGNSYDYLFPLLMTAMIYLAMVMFFTHLVGKLERRLRNSER